MQILEINPSDVVEFILPNQRQKQLKLSNPTLRPLAVKIIASHEYQISVDPSQLILSSFDEQTIKVSIFFSQDANVIANAKLRAYIREIQQQNPQQDVFATMFAKKQQLLSVDIKLEISLTKSLSTTRYKCDKGIQNWFIKRILPLNTEQQVIKNNLLKFCDTIGQIKGIYDFGKVLIAEVSQSKVNHPAFYSEWFGDTLHLYAIGRLISYGKQIRLPDLVLIDQNKTNKKDFHEKIQNATTNEQFTTPVQTPEMKQVLQKVKMVNSISGFNELKQKQVKENLRKIQKKKEKSDVRQSFFNQKSIRSGKKRNKSQEHSRILDIEQQQQIPQMNFIALKENRQAKNFEVNAKPQKPLFESEIQFSRLVLNVKIQNDIVYVLLKDCLIYFDLQNVSEKITLKFEAIDDDDIKPGIPFEIMNNQAVFAHQNYLYWIDLKKGAVDWKYVQRKNIYAIGCLYELNLIVIGGQNFSKLAYLGKGTTRSTLKVYTCGSSSKHQHLYTYQIPTQQSLIVRDLHYIEASPAKNKLLVVFTQTQNQQHLYFIRVKAYNIFQIYSKMQVNEIGIQHILELQWNSYTGLVCLQDLQLFNCLKKIKVKCQYEKIQIVTESVKIPVGLYQSLYLTGRSIQEKMIGYVVVLDRNSKKINISSTEGKQQEIQSKQNSTTKALMSKDKKWIIIVGKSNIKLVQRRQYQ